MPDPAPGRTAVYGDLLDAYWRYLVPTYKNAGAAVSQLQEGLKLLPFRIAGGSDDLEKVW